MIDAFMFQAIRIAFSGALIVCFAAVAVVCAGVCAMIVREIYREMRR